MSFDTPCEALANAHNRQSPAKQARTRERQDTRKTHKATKSKSNRHDKHKTTKTNTTYKNDGTQKRTQSQSDSRATQLVGSIVAGGCSIRLSPLPRPPSPVAGFPRVRDSRSTPRQKRPQQVVDTQLFWRFVFSKVSCVPVWVVFLQFMFRKK